MGPENQLKIEFSQTTFTSHFKLEDIKMFLRTCCQQGQYFKQKSHVFLEFFLWKSENGLTKKN